MVKISSYADTTTFLSLPLPTDNLLHQLFPYYLIITFLLIGYSLYRTNMTNRKIHLQTFSLSKQIAASDTTSKVFCHYMKNELIAIQSELNTLDPHQAPHQSVQNAISRCENLYNRLDSIHKSTKSSELFLKEICFNEYLSSFLDEFSYEFQGYKINVNLSESKIYVLLDDNYFTQGLHNIITNALDAMKDLPKSRHHLDVSLKDVNQWAVLLIQDYGIGIPDGIKENIFAPFYSSQPITKHWGVGLTLTHKIISAHEGHIEIDSTEGEGTLVKIMLPRLKGTTPMPAQNISS